MSALKSILFEKQTVAKLGLAIAGLAISSTALADTITAFSFTSSPESGIGQGQTLTVTPADGFLFSPSVDSRSVFISLSDGPPPGLGPDYYTVEFVAPIGATLSVGHYGNAEFTGGINFPGLIFSSDGRGDDVTEGSFDILDYKLNSDGTLASFAANFYQYDQQNSAAWELGEIRFNSNITLTPLPEPSTNTLMLLGLSLGWVALRTSKRYPR